MISIVVGPQRFGNETGGTRQGKNRDHPDPSAVINQDTEKSTEGFTQTCSYSDFSEKPPVKPIVKNSHEQKNL